MDISVYFPMILFFLCLAVKASPQSPCHRTKHIKSGLPPRLELPGKILHFERRKGCLNYFVIRCRVGSFRSHRATITGCIDARTSPQPWGKAPDPVNIDDFVAFAEGLPDLLYHRKFGGSGHPTRVSAVA